MRNSILLFFLLSLFVVDAKGQKKVFEDDFEEYSPFVLNSFKDKWIALDVDQLPNSSLTGFNLLEGDSDWNKSDLPKDFVVIDYNKMKFTGDVEYLEGIDYSAQKGTQALVVFSALAQNDIHSNDWLITKQSIQMEESGNVVTFWVKSALLKRNNHKFRVLATSQQIPANISADDFTEEKYGFKLLSDASRFQSKVKITYPGDEEATQIEDYAALYDYVEGGNSNEWIQLAFSLDEFAGKKVHIAIQHLGVCFPMNYQEDIPDEKAELSQAFMIDNFEVWTGVCGNLREVSDITEEEVTDVSATISWKGLAEKYRIVYGESGFAAGQGDTVYVDGATRATIAGLKENTVYGYFVSPYCENSSVAAHALGKRNTLQTEITPLPPIVIAEEDYYYGFEKGVFEGGLELEGWSQLTIKNVEWIATNVEPVRNGNNCARLGSTMYEAEAWMFSRGIFLTAGDRIQVEFYYSTYSGFEDGTLELFIGMDATPEGQQTSLWKDENFMNTAYMPANSVAYSGEFFTAEETGIYYIGFHARQEENGKLGAIYIDDFSVRSFESIQNDQEYMVIYEDGFERADIYNDNWTLAGADILGTPIEGLNTVVSGLLSEEDVAGVDNTIYDFTPYSGTQSFLFFGSASDNTGEYLILSEKTLGTQGNFLSFMAKSAKREVTEERFQVYISTENPIDNGFDASTLYPVSEELNIQDYVEDSGDTNWVKFLFGLDIEEYLGKSVYVVIHYKGNAGRHALLIDDFSLKAGACDAQVYSAGVRSISLSTTSADLYWESDEAATYEVRWGEAGFNVNDEKQYQSAQSYSRELQIEDLQENTHYSFYVKSLCAEDRYSERDWAGPYNFYTKAEIVELPYSYDFENGDYLAEGWRIHSYLEDGSNGWYITEDGEDNLSLAYANLSGVAGENKIFVRPVRFPYNQLVRVTFDYRVENPKAGDEVQFFAVERLVVASYESYQFATFWENKNLQASETYQRVVETGSFITYDDSEYFFGFVTNLSGADSRLYIDNILIEKDAEGIEGEGNGAKNSLLIYPNPATDVINIALPSYFNAATTTVKVTDMTGKQVKAEAYQSRLDVSSLAAGIYSISVNDGVNRTNKTFIKK